MGFVNLHVHTHFSLLDGMNRIEQAVARAVELGQVALAMTDHGNVAGAVKFYRACKAAGIHPIIGMEGYIVPDRTERKGRMGDYNHIILLAETDEGLANLFRISADAFHNGFYYKPRTDLKTLAQYSEGLIVTSACLNGELSVAILQGNLDEARRILETYREIFGDRFYVEIQSSTYEAQWKVNPVLVDLAKAHGVPFIVTGDCHYTLPEDHDAHDLLLAIQTGTKRSDPDRLRLPTADYWLKDEDTTLKILLDGGLSRADAIKAIDTTFELAGRCTARLALADETGQIHYPQPLLPPGLTADELLAYRAREGLVRKLARSDVPESQFPAYWRRLDYELEVLREAGLSGYFLVEQEIVEFCSKAGIPHMARGSAGGSLVAWALGITNTDPIKHRLSFERFYVPGRKGRPDIDLDVDASRRQEVLDWIVHRFGADHTALIAAYATLNPRAILRDVGRSLGYPYPWVDQLCKQIPQSWTDEEGEKVTASFARLFSDHPHIKEMAESQEYREVFGYAQKLEGLARHASIHAGGVIISPVPLEGRLPTMRAPGSSEERAPLPVSQFDMEDVEALGFLKFDVLGVDALTVRARTLELIRRRTGKAPDLDHLPLDEPEVYELLKSGRTYGVFQVGTAPGKRACQIIQPDNFDELIDLLSLMRPGPANNGFLELYAEHKRRGIDPSEYVHPEMRRIMGWTKGVMVYQEQILDIVRTFAGFSHAEADAVRKAVGKKLFDKLASIGDDFIRRSVERGMLTEEQAKELWSQILKFGSYTFNRSHACAYAYLAYQTAWLKIHYPADFMAAVIANESHGSGDDRDARVQEAVEECRAMGLTILGPDVNASEVDAVSVDDKTIRLGLAQVRYLDKAAVAIVDPSKRPYTSLEDFLAKHTSRVANKKVVTVLIASGAFDSLPGRSGHWRERLSLFAEYDRLRTAECRTAKQVEKARLGKSLKLSKGHTLSIPSKLMPAHVAQWETMLLSFVVSTHPAAELEHDRWAEVPIGGLCQVAGYIVRVTPTVTKRGKNPGSPMAFCDVDLADGRLVRAVVFPALYKQIKPYLKAMALFWARGRKDAPDAFIVNEWLLDNKSPAPAPAPAAAEAEVPVPF